MPTFIHQPNDKLFKLSMGELRVAEEFFQTHLPPTFLKKMNLATLKLEKHSFVDEAYKANEADVVYSVQLEDHTAYIYILCEQQTVIDPTMAFRLLVYTVRLIENYLRQYPGNPLPLVYPVVVYSGAKHWDAPLEIFPLFGAQEKLAREWFLQPYQLIDIQRMSDEALMRRTWSGLVEFVLKYREVRNFAAFLEALLPWMDKIEAEGQQVGTFLGKIVLRYLIDGIQADDVELFTKKVDLYLAGDLRGEAMTLAQKFEERGEKRGEKRGIEKGVQQGTAVLIKHLIQCRFGNIPAAHAKRIAQADMQTLLVWSERILGAVTLDEIFAESSVS